MAFLAVGPAKHAYIKDGISDYCKRIERYAPFEAIEVKAGSKSTTDTKAMREAEADRLLKRLKPGDYAIAFDEKGKGVSSKEFAAFVGDLLLGLSGGKQRVVFIVGGAYGLSKRVIERADKVLSLSSFTLAGGVARLVVAEQVYRAFTIIRGEPYSH